jgi:hypothetical protein
LRLKHSDSIRSDSALVSRVRFLDDADDDLFTAKGPRIILFGCRRVMDTFTPNDFPARLRLRAVGALLVAFALSGCAASSLDIHAQFVSPETYQELSCQQIGAEGERVGRRVAEISGSGHGNEGSAAWLLTQPIVVTWPTPWLATSDEETTELARLKGEFEALEQASTLKRCSLHFKQQSN